MKKEIINVALSFGAIIFMVFFGIFYYQKKDLLYLKIEEYEILSNEYAIKFDQIILEHSKKELEEKLASDLLEQEMEDKLKTQESLKLNQIQFQKQQAVLLQKQQEAAATQAAIEQAKQQQLAEQLAQEKLKQQQLNAQKIAAQKASRKSRAS